MKATFTVFFALLSFITFTSFRGNNIKREELILGKWRLNVEESRANYDKIFKSSGKDDADEFAKSMVETLLLTLGETVTEYKESGEVINTITTKDAEGIIKTRVTSGKWTIDNKDEQLIVSENGDEKTFKIISMAEDELRLAIKKEGKKSWIMVYSAEDMVR